MGVPISNVTRRVVFAASGTGPYSFTFEILANTDIAVYKDDALLTLTTDYTVTINANGTGSITLTAAPTGATQIAIVGNRSIARTTDFVTGGDFFANTVNDELDQQTIFNQQNAEGLGRALQAPQTDPTTIDMTLPRASVRAGKVLAFDANGDPTTGEVIGDFRGNWASGTAYNKRDIIKDTSNSNIYYCVTAHTASGSQPISTNADSAKWSLIIDAAAAAAAQAAAEAAQAAAETAEANAETAETNAETAETNAETAATAAASSASAASTSATNAASSASAASSSASTASTKASEASTSATNAASSASSASTSATSASSSASSASTSASSASTSATNAASSASSASTSASTATTQATNASNSASAAATSETNAASSASTASTQATNAASSATAAAASAASAASSLDSFDDRYLGSKASDPTLDNDGNALVTGALYYNTTTQMMKVYDGANWIAATAAGTTAMLVYKYVATNGQTTFSGAASVGGTLSYTSGNIIVFVNGVSLDSTDYTATNGTSVVLGAGAALNDEVVIVAFKSFTVADTYTKGEVDAFAVKLTGTQTVAGVKTFSDNVGVGVTPSAWTNYTATQVKTAALWSGNSINSFLSLTANVYYGSGYKYITSDYATEYYQYAGQHIWRTAGVGTAGNAISFTQAMTLNASGQLIVNDTTAGTAKMKVLQSGDNVTTWLTNGSLGTTYPVLFLENYQAGSDSKNLIAGDNNTGTVFKVTTNGGGYFANTLLMGTTSGGLGQSGIILTPAYSATNAAGIAVQHANGTASGSTYMGFIYNGSTIGSITQNGTTAVAYNTTSDYRLKENVQPLSGALARIAALKPCTYTWKSAPDEIGEGFIAHELAEVCPQSVTGEKDAVETYTDEDGVEQTRPKYQSIDTSFLVATLTAAIQEQQAIIEQLKADVAALKGTSQ